MNQAIVCRNKPKVIDYIGIIVLLFSSRSIVLWGNYGAAAAAVIFFVYALYRFIKKRGHFEGRNSILYTAILVFAILINRFLLNTDVIANMWIASILTCVSGLLFYASYDFNTFKKCYLDVLALILLINIPLHLIDVTVGMPWAETTYIDEFHEGKMFFFYNLGKGRLCGIWGEPGVTQIFINTAFLMFLPEIRSKRLTHNEKMKLLILVIALLLGTSTMGYLVFAGIIFSAFSSSFKRMKVGTKLLAIPIVVFTIVMLIYSPAVQEKIEPGTDSVGSFGIRYNDNLACLTMALERPLTGYGFGTASYEKKSIEYNNLANSNGVFAYAARIGIWWIALYVLFIYFAMKKMNLNVPMFFIILMILAMEFDEDFIDFPMSYIFLMNFKSYPQPVLLRQ